MEWSWNNHWITITPFPRSPRTTNFPFVQCWASLETAMEHDGTSIRGQFEDSSAIVHPPYPPVIKHGLEFSQAAADALGVRLVGEESFDIQIFYILHSHILKNVGKKWLLSIEPGFWSGLTNSKYFLTRFFKRYFLRHLCGFWTGICVASTWFLVRRASQLLSRNGVSEMFQMRCEGIV